MEDSEQRVVLVSACLLGVACRFDGESRRDEAVLGYLEGKNFVPVCPESLSGLPVPREPAEFDCGHGAMTLSGENRIVMRDGTDVTDAFLRGGRQALMIARLVHASEAVLKDRSPSCGVHQVYRNGVLAPGKGVFAALLLDEGVMVKSEQDLE